MEIAALALGIAASLLLALGASVQIYFEYQDLKVVLDENRTTQATSGMIFRLASKMNAWISLVRFTASWSLVLLGSLCALTAAILALVAQG